VNLSKSKPVVEIQVRAVAATSGGYAVFLGNADKVFVMFVDQSVGTAIAMFIDAPVDVGVSFALVRSAVDCQTWGLRQ
jgi:hypothetical protein